MNVADSTIFVIDDEASIRKSLQRLLQSEGYRVESFCSADEFLARPRYKGHGCILTDLRMPGLSGLDLQRELGQHKYAMPIIFLSAHGDVPSSVRAMKGGAMDFLEKPVEDKDLLPAIRRALDRHESNMEAHEEHRAIQARIDSLTPREKEVLSLVVTGMLNKQIAAELGIAEKTVKVHRGRVMEKMGVFSVAELVRLTEKVGLKAGG